MKRAVGCTVIIEMKVLFVDVNWDKCSSVESNPLWLQGVPDFSFTSHSVIDAV
jgi:hypothetical protein